MTLKLGRKRAQALSKLAQQLQYKKTAQNKALDGRAAQETIRVSDDTCNAELWLEVKYDIEGKAKVSLDLD